MNLDLIPTTDAPSPDAQPSRLVAHIRAAAPRRRAVLRGLAVAAAASTLAPFDWYLDRRAAQAAPPGPATEFLDCTKSYGEQANTWPRDGRKLCIDGFRRGSFPCNKGAWHFEGTRANASGSEVAESYRLARSCWGRNAWRWKSGSSTYRCSDAHTIMRNADGEVSQTGMTVAACKKS